MGYEVFVYKTCEQVVPGPEIFYMSKWGEWVKLYFYIGVIRGGGKTILVDTGVRDVNEINPSVAFLGEQAMLRMAPREDIESIMAKAGVSFGDVDDVLITHLHYDHVSNLKRFPRARIVVNKKGWQAALAPRHRCMFPPGLFPRDIFAYLVNEAWERLHLAEDEEEIYPGIRVFWVGGHTPCSMAVCVETSQGRVVFTGDTVCHYANIEQNIPVGMSYSIAESLDALERIRSEADIILPGHDPLIVTKYPTGQVVGS